MIIIHAMTGFTYRPRALGAVVEQALRLQPVVVVSGARQTGKTTLVRNLPSAPDRTFRSLDDLETLEMARKRPDDLLAQGRRLTLDEVQRTPELLLAIKRDIDHRRQRGRFLLTGSADLLLMRQVSESLAGRAVYLRLSPFTAGERRGEGSVPPWSELLSARTPSRALEVVGGFDASRANWRADVLRGGMPPAALARSRRERALWCDGFVQTYLERDLRDLSQVSSLPDFRRLMSLAVHRIGNLLNQTDLGRDAGLAQATAHRYLNLLETSFQIHRIAPFVGSLSKRLIKAPKLYWGDTGLASHLAGLATAMELCASPLAGPLLENRILSGLLAWRETSQPRADVHFWRTAGGAEVDFVIERGSRLLPVEVKTAHRLQMRDLRHLDLFLEDYPKRAPFAVVLHDLNEPQQITRRIIGLPPACFL